MNVRVLNRLRREACTKLASKYSPAYMCYVGFALLKQHDSTYFCFVWLRYKYELKFMLSGFALHSLLVILININTFINTKT